VRKRERERERGKRKIGKIEINAASLIFDQSSFAVTKTTCL
jgi:hypothetical protein